MKNCKRKTILSNIILSAVLVAVYLLNFVSFKSLNFVNHLNNLKALKLGENISIGTDTVDFSKSNLEYLIYSDFQLKTFPFSLILPKSIKFLAIFNISSNILRENWEKDFLVPEVKYYFRR